MAGESAEEVARRTREKIARLSRHAERFEKGAAGEVITAAALSVLPAEWVVLHDVRWPGRRVANIDHIAIGPGGVFVIDSKNWTGRVEVRDGVLRRDGYRRQRETSSCVDAAVAVAGLIPSVDPRLVHPVLCLVARDFAATYAGGALVCSTSSVVEALREHPVALWPNDVRRVAAELRRLLHPAGERRSAGPAARRVAGPQGVGLGEVSRPPRDSRDVRPRRPPRIARLLLGLSLLGASGLGLLVLVAYLLSRFSGAVGLDSWVEHQDTVALGATRQLAGATGRPPLAITADRIRTVGTVGKPPLLFDGNRWVAVQVSVHNIGRRPWHSQPGTTWSLEDERGVAHKSQGAVRTTAGPSLPALVRVPPGQTQRGWIVFQVPLYKAIVQVTVTVGPGQPATASWVVDRQ